MTTDTLDHYHKYLASKQQWLVNNMIDSYHPDSFEYFNIIKLDTFIKHINVFDEYSVQQFYELFQDEEFLNREFQIGILLQILHTLPTKFIKTLKVDVENSNEGFIQFTSTVREDLTVKFTCNYIQVVVQNDDMLLDYTFTSHIQHEGMSGFLKLDYLNLPE